MEGAGSNVEIAHSLSERKDDAHSLSHQTVEIIEALVLAMVAIATAWSGYQAARWGGHQSKRYAQAGKLRVQAEGALNFANQERLYDAATVVEWLKAENDGKQKLAAILERRLLPEFRPAFEAWKKTDPLNNPDAPAGPEQMAEYHSSRTEQAAKLNEEASQVFEQGDQAREYVDDYVRVTVMLALVLLLTAISQRFKIRAVRVAIAIMATLLLCIPLYRILTLPRI